MAFRFDSDLRKSIISSVKSSPVSPEINFSSRSSQKSSPSEFPDENNLEIPPLHFSRTPFRLSRSFANIAIALPPRSPSHEYQLVTVLPGRAVLSPS